MAKYAPKFPQVKLNHFERKQRRVNPIEDYERLVAMRNAKVSIGAKINYGK